jgi:hypothetical protein
VGNPAAFTLAGARIAKQVQAAGRFERFDDESFAIAPPPVSMASPRKVSVDLNPLFDSNDRALLKFNIYVPRTPGVFINNYFLY